MNDPAQTLMVDFDGAIVCRQPSGAVNLLLRGRERGAEYVEALFAGAAPDAPAVLPAMLHDVRLYQDSPNRFTLLAKELRTSLTARSLQLHRDAARAFLRAVPPPRVPLGRRIGWTLLLTLLRIPGAAALLMRLRGRS
jgi:hypothetical protein